jgi:heme/copper-type cytochrome/quinol oxidase subunit 2
MTQAGLVSMSDPRSPIASTKIWSKLKRLKRTKRVLATIVVIVAVAGFFVSAYALNLFGSSTNCWVRPTGPSGTAIFTVVMADEGVNVGYNGSKFHAIPWPVMNVTYNQSVIVHVINNDTVAHGFVIAHYFDAGIGGQAGLAPGKCFDVSFTASQKGPFTVFCTILCPIHQFMLNGRLNVN